MELKTTFENTGSDVIQVVSFILAEEEYAIGIIDVQEVIHIPPIAKIPQMPDFVRGVINIRGNIIPVFDLRRKFLLNDREFDAESRILVVQLGNDYLGFTVDKVKETLRLDTKMIDPAPPVKMAIDRESVIGIGRFNSRMIIIIDINKLHQSMLEDIKSMGGNNTIKVGIT
ncbi:MAG: purine-binding chemotaxis protein CheW [Oligoflexia bacterium]|nr:purine-binding chemotaxis protein CheW [Oligoflexia bacterium]